MTNGLPIHFQKFDMDILTAIDVIQDAAYVLEELHQEDTHLESMTEVSNKVTVFQTHLQQNLHFK